MEELINDEILDTIVNSLLFIEGESFFCQHAYFMCKAQIVEMSMKKLLVEEYGYDEERIERWTFGHTINELEKSNLRQDFISLLRELLEFRNSMAHEFLSTTAVGNSIAGEEFQILQHKELKKALFKVEELIHVYEFLTENNYL